MKSRSHRLPTISDTPDDWVDESWTVDCVCGVNFDDGEEMVDCDECGVWVHTRCSRYVKSEKLFSCDKCKSKKLRKESEETEVAQLLVELPTKTIRMDNPYPMSCPPQSSLQVWTEVPLEEKVHVQGIPGGDPSLFHGVSSVFSKELWKCTGYVPKKFNFQYKEFPCWDNRQDDDDDDDDKKEKEETENHACKGANALFSLSKENPPTTDMGPPTTDTKKQDVENKEKSLMKPIVIHSVNKKKDDSKVVKDLNKKKKEGDSKKRDLQTFESVSTTSSDAKQSESYEGKGHKVSKTDKQSCKHENSRADDLQENHKSDGCIDNNTPIFSGKSPENTPRDASRPKQMEENDENQVPPSSVEISPQKDDVIASSLKPNPVETITMKNEATTSNGTQPNMENLEKVDITLNRVPNTSSSQPIEVKTIETNQIGNISNHQNDSKVDNSNSKNLGQDSRTCDEHLSEVKKETSSVSQIHKAQNVEKSQPHAEKSQPSQPHVEKSQPSQHHVEKSQPHGTVNQGKMISKPSVPDKARYFSTDKQKGENNNKSKKDNLFTELPRNGDLSEKPKKIVKDLHKSLSTSALKSSHLSKSSVSKKNSSDSKDPAILPSSKTATTTPDSGDSANSESSQKEKISQLNRQPPPVPKNHLPHVHPPPSSNSPATLSDEELALLLHQELNSSPRVPRVPRMRHAGSLPQLNSTPSTSTLMKRTLSSGGKDNLLVSRKRNKDLASNSRELDGGKKGERVPSLPNSRRQQEVMKNGSAKVIHHVDKNAPLGSTTVSSGPSSSNEANENNMSSPQNGSDDEGGLVGVPTHRTLPGLIAEIMSKGKRMAYEELCNAVLPHWPNLRKHNGERYAYSSHSQAVLDCLRNRSEWSRLVDRGPKTNAGRKRRKSEADPETIEEESEEEDEDYSTDNNKTVGEDYPKGKRKARKHRRLALQETRIKEVRRRRRKSEIVSDDNDSSSDSSEEAAFSDEEGRTAVANEASGSSDEMDSSV